MYFQKNLTSLLLISRILSSIISKHFPLSKHLKRFKYWQKKIYYPSPSKSSSDGASNLGTYLFRNPLIDRKRQEIFLLSITLVFRKMVKFLVFDVSISKTKHITSLNIRGHLKTIIWPHLPLPSWYTWFVDASLSMIWNNDWFIILSDRKEIIHTYSLH